MLCHTDRYFRHFTSFSHVSWNAHLSAAGVVLFSHIIDAWFEEGKDFFYIDGQCRENATCQHYTQVQIQTGFILTMLLGVRKQFDVLCSWFGLLQVIWAVPSISV